MYYCAKRRNSRVRPRAALLVLRSERASLLRRVAKDERVVQISLIKEIIQRKSDLLRLKNLLGSFFLAFSIIELLSRKKTKENMN